MSLAQETRTSNNLCYPMSNLLTQCTSVSIIIDLSSSWDNRGVVRAWEELYKSNNTFVFETSANNIYSIAKYILQMLFRLIRYAIQLVFSDQLQLQNLSLLYSWINVVKRNFPTGLLQHDDQHVQKSVSELCSYNHMS